MVWGEVGSAGQMCCPVAPVSSVFTASPVGMHVKIEVTIIRNHCFILVQCSFSHFVGEIL